MSVLIREAERNFTTEGRHYDDRGRDGSGVATGKESKPPPEAGRARNRLSPGASRGSVTLLTPRDIQPSDTDFRLPASRMLKE